MTTFKPFPKIPRFDSEYLVTEKIDGTNASIIISDPGDGQRLTIQAGSKTRLLTPGKLTDNFGFAQWVDDNANELLKLGVGQHYGEWYGSGINRGYGLSERRFALFNVDRWRVGDTFERHPDLPDCVEVVPVIGTGVYTHHNIDSMLRYLSHRGSYAVPVYMNPEGLILHHKRSNQLFKKLYDDKPKGLQGDNHVPNL